MGAGVGVASCEVLCPVDGGDFAVTSELDEFSYSHTHTHTHTLGLRFRTSSVLL